MSHLVEQLADHTHMTASAVEQNKIRRCRERAVFVAQMRQAAIERFAHTGIVVRALHCLDVEGAVVRPTELSVAADDHARRQMLCTKVGNIVRLDALGIDLQTAQLCQTNECSVISLQRGTMLCGAFAGVVLDHAAKGVKASSLGHAHDHAMPRQSRQIGRKRFQLLLLHREG